MYEKLIEKLRAGNNATMKAAANAIERLMKRLEDANKRADSAEEHYNKLSDKYYGLNSVDLAPPYPLNDYGVLPKEWREDDAENAIERLMKRLEVSKREEATVK